MKTQIHPEYVECRVTCSCGNQFVTRATVPELRVELCAECHPFYTGKQKLVDTGGRVERFARRYAQAQTKAEVTSAEEVSGEAAPDARPKRKKRAEGPKRKPPVATKGGPRPKYEGRPPGEGGRGEGRRGQRGRGDGGRGERGRGDERRVKESPAEAGEAPPAESPPAES